MEREVKTNKNFKEILPKKKIARELSLEEVKECWQISWSNYLKECSKFEELHQRQMQNPEIARVVKAGARLG